MATPKALIFDVDGTLAETEELHRRSFNETFAAYNLDWYWDEAVYDRLLRVAGGQKRLRHFIETEQPSCAGDFIDEVANMHAKKTARYGELIRAGEVELRPGIADLINEALDKDIALAISTSTSRPNIDTLFEATLGLDVLARFKAVCCSNDVENNKPAPDLYLLALERLGLPAQQCLAFEDSQMGLASATAAGIPTIITVSKYCRNDDFTGAQLVMDDLVAGGFSL